MQHAATYLDTCRTQYTDDEWDAVKDDAQFWDHLLRAAFESHIDATIAQHGTPLSKRQHQQLRNAITTSREAFTEAWHHIENARVSRKVDRLDTHPTYNAFSTAYAFWNHYHDVRTSPNADGYAQLLRRARHLHEQLPHAARVQLILALHPVLESHLLTSDAHDILTCTNHFLAETGFTNTDA